MVVLEVGIHSDFRVPIVEQRRGNWLVHRFLFSVAGESPFLHGCI